MLMSDEKGIRIHRYEIKFYIYRLSIILLSIILARQSDRRYNDEVIKYRILILIYLLYQKIFMGNKNIEVFNYQKK